MMEKLLKKYKKVCGQEFINKLTREASKLSGKHILHINSTYQGGGVAEILNSLVPLMNEVGIDAGWRILHASPDFFRATKKFNNAFQGRKVHLTKMKQKIYLETLEKFSEYTHLNHSLIIIHDIQPLALIKFYKKKQPWIWRCHYDLTAPNKRIFNHFKKYMLKYDLMVVLNKKYLQDLPMEQAVMYPSIDPFTIKNRELSEKTMLKYLHKYGIKQNKPIITQVSRFDALKDPLGVIKIFNQVRKKIPCHLVLIGSTAMDDPEGPKIYKKILKQTNGKKDITLINEQNDILVNTLQRKSAVIIQKSIREGFGLTVSEALWKGTPVVASNVGGISDQIVHGKNGYLLEPHNIKGFANSTIKILKDGKLRKEMGQFGKQHVKENFLITAHLKNWIDILNKVFKHK